MMTQDRRSTPTLAQPTWIIPNLLRTLAARIDGDIEDGGDASVERGVAADRLAEGESLGEYLISRFCRSDATHDHYIVTHSVDGHDRSARVIKREALAMAPRLGSRMLSNASRMVGHRTPNLLEIVGAGVTDEAEPRPFVISERVVGRDLASYMRKHGRLPWSLALEIGRQCAIGLTALHDLGWVHADLRPETVMLQPVAGDGFQVKLLGFDLASARGRGGRISVDVDLYALGVLLYCLISGSSPLAMEASVVALGGGRRPKLHPLNVACADSDVPDAVSGLVARLTSPRAAHRFAAAREVLARIELIIEGVDACEDSYVAMLRRRVSTVARVVRSSVRLPARRAAEVAELGQRSLVMPTPRPASSLATAGAPWPFRAMAAGLLSGALCVLVGGAFHVEQLETISDGAEQPEVLRRGVRVIPTQEPVQVEAVAATETETETKTKTRRRVRTGTRRSRAEIPKPEKPRPSVHSLDESVVRAVPQERPLQLPSVTDLEDEEQLVFSTGEERSDANLNTDSDSGPDSEEDAEPPSFLPLTPRPGASPEEGTAVFLPVGSDRMGMP